MRNNPRPWSAVDRRHIAAMVVTVLALNAVGWGVLVAVVAPQQFEVGSAGVFGVGLGVTAFLLGARHAFDADHIAVIDNTTRKLVGDGAPSTATGFWFGMGHSSVVFGLSLLLSLGVRALADPVQDDGSVLQGTLGTVGTISAGTFLIAIGLMNLSALVGIIHAYRHLKAGTFDEEHLEHHLHNRGFLARIFKRTTQRVSKARHLYPVGLLMGLGFDTATQIALLVLAGGTAAFALPWYAIMTLPVLFGAGMILFDSLDGILMSRAYSWAFLKPIRKIYYNLTVTLLSVTVALAIGVLLLVQLASEWVPGLGWAGRLDLEYVGFGLVALFVLVWGASVAWYHLGHVEEKFEKGLA
ncbi:high-affinity nickel-transport protein [Nocardioides sp. BE266]|uniref:HoxN/HupN/NixA family nickel/cobalt transporter n=1 Tax=Nocardioides sp. BE266 TaxID=2817725 RepID=UPI00285F3DBB|nr:HoxN/HupN/NixA family nickel/cobalt transporter [Nocardioides sp. BE266]MDR7255259.1 high-affinity nickel-transport protein [Nocardioides sp. BE266]